MHQNFNYIEEANVTMSDGFHSNLVSQQALEAFLIVSIEALQKLDKIKKALFYGREPDGVYYMPHETDIKVHTLHKDPHSAVRLLHGILGVATEAGEMLEALRKGLNGEGFDTVNLFEECGDNQWYIAAMLRVMGKTFTDAQVANIAKLRKRFPNKFTEFDANNRNLTGERTTLEDLFTPNEAELAKRTDIRS